MSARGKRARSETEPKAKDSDKANETATSTTTDKPSFEMSATSKTHFPLSNEFLRLLTNTPAESLRTADNVIFICKRDDTVVDVWKGLVRHHFLSVPVLQKKGNKYYGFLDIADIVNYVVDSFGKTTLESSENYWDLVAQDDLFQKKLVNDIMVYPINRRNPFHPVTLGYSLFSVIEILAREKGLHRVPILDNNENRRLMGLITQSQIVKFLNTNISIMGEKSKTPVHLIPGSVRSVISMNQQRTAIEGFKMMMEKRVSGIAIVDDEGKLVGNLSLRDLKAISPDGRLFYRLYESIKNFLQKIRKEYAEYDGRPRTPVHLNLTDTLETAIKLLAEHDVHRIYITDNDKKPIGVLSLKDILLYLITNN